MDKKKILKYIIIIAVLLIPLMYSFFYLKAYWDPYGNLQDVKIAMVNLDKGKDKENQGNKLVNTMIENGTFDINKVSAQDAKDGLINGTYYAVITIPENFTKDLNSAKEKNKQIAQITYSPNQKTNYLASQIINSAIKTIELNLQSEVAGEVTETLKNKLDDVPDKLQTISDGAEKLDDGSKKLKDGSKSLADGTNKLNDNYAKFDNGVKSAFSGSTQLDNGINALKNGANTLKNGTNTLSDGTKSLSDGANTLFSGTKSLSAGANTLSNGTKSLSNGASTLSDGTSSLAKGASDIKKYLSQLYDGIQKTKSGYKDIDSGIDEIVKTLSKLQKSMDSISSQASSIDELKDSNETAISTLKNSNSTINSNYKSNYSSLLGGKSLSNVTDSDINKLATTIASNYIEALGKEQATKIGKTNAALLTTWRDTYIGNEKLIELSTGNLTAVKTISSLLQSDDLKKLANSETTKKLKTLKDGSGTMKSTLATLESSIKSIYNGSKDLSKGASDVSKGASTLSKGVTKVSKGASSVSTGASDVSKGASSLSKGAKKIDKGMKTLSSGAKTLYSGTKTLKNGSSKLNKGISTLASSSKTVKTGISNINSGATTLGDGLNELNKGTKTFTREINSGLQDTKIELQKLNGLPEFTKDPVKINEEDYGKIDQYGLSFTPLFLSIGLWVGALMAYVVLYYDQDRRFKLLGRYANNKFLQIALYFAIAILQGLITGFLLKVGLGITATSTVLYYFTCIFISIVFMSIIQFLIMNFDDIGKFLALIILVLQLAASGGTFPVQTVAKIFQQISPILPMTYSIRLVKEAVVMQDTGFAITNIGVLSLYLIIPLAITFGVQYFKRKKSLKNPTM